MITLYHGSNCDVRKPIPSKGRRGTDFGRGFYLTPDMDSARSMASLVAAREAIRPSAVRGGLVRRRGGGRKDGRGAQAGRPRRLPPGPGTPECDSTGEYLSCIRTFRARA